MSVKEKIVNQLYDIQENEFLSPREKVLINQIIGNIQYKLKEVKEDE